MGAWDLGPFDNDCALDFVGELEEGSAERVAGGLAQALARVADGHIESPRGNEAVAAAVLVAGRLGATLDSPSATELLDSHPFEADGELRRLAVDALDRLASPENNEWYELWDDAGSMDGVLERLRPYRRTLTLDPRQPGLFDVG